MTVLPHHIYLGPTLFQALIPIFFFGRPFDRSYFFEALGRYVINHISKVGEIVLLVI